MGVHRADFFVDMKKLTSYMIYYITFSYKYWRPIDEYEKRERDGIRPMANKIVQSRFSNETKEEKPWLSTPLLLMSWSLVPVSLV